MSRLSIASKTELMHITQTDQDSLTKKSPCTLKNFENALRNGYFRFAAEILLRLDVNDQLSDEAIASLSSLQQGTAETLFHCVMFYEPLAKVFINDFELDANVVDNSQQTPLHHAVLCNLSFNTIAALCKKGANPSLKDTHEKTPIDYAMEQRQFIVWNFLTLVDKQAIESNSFINSDNKLKRFEAAFCLEKHLNAIIGFLQKKKPDEALATEKRFWDSGSMFSFRENPNLSWKMYAPQWIDSLVIPEDCWVQEFDLLFHAQNGCQRIVDSFRPYSSVQLDNIKGKFLIFINMKLDSPIEIQIENECYISKDSTKAVMEAWQNYLQQLYQVKIDVSDQKSTCTIA